MGGGGRLCEPHGVAPQERGARREAPGFARSSWPCSQFALGTVDLGYEEALLHRTAWLMCSDGSTVPETVDPSPRCYL